MNNLFLALILISFIGLIVGIVKPSIIKIKSRKHTVYIFGGSMIVFFILFGVTSSPIKSPETQSVQQSVAQQPAPKPETLEEKITKVINSSLGSNTNTSKPRVVDVEIDKYNASMLSEYKYKSGDSIVGILIKINADENLTTNLQKGTMADEATKIAQAVFSLDQTIGDIIIWSRLPVKDQYGNIKDDTAIVYSMSRSLFDKINWNNFNHRDLPTLLKSEHTIDDRNNYFESIKF